MPLSFSPSCHRHRQLRPWPSAVFVSWCLVQASGWGAEPRGRRVPPALAAGARVRKRSPAASPGRAPSPLHLRGRTGTLGETGTLGFGGRQSNAYRNAMFCVCGGSRLFSSLERWRGKAAAAAEQEKGAAAASGAAAGPGDSPGARRKAWPRLTAAGAVDASGTFSNGKGRLRVSAQPGQRLSDSALTVCAVPDLTLAEGKRRAKAALPCATKPWLPVLWLTDYDYGLARMIQACPRAVGLTLPPREPKLLRFLPITLYLLNSLALLWLIKRVFM